jgi:outer membrane biosynthesis protein TonB
VCVISATAIKGKLSGSVLGAVKKWRYQPRIENGMPVEVDTQIAVDFEK